MVEKASASQNGVEDISVKNHLLDSPHGKFWLLIQGSRDASLAFLHTESVSSIATALGQLAQPWLGEAVLANEPFLGSEEGHFPQVQSSFHGVVSYPHTVCLFILLLPKVTKHLCKWKYLRNHF